MIVLRSPIVFKKSLDRMDHGSLSQFLSFARNIGKRNYQSQLDDPTDKSLIMAVLLWIARRWPEAPLYLEKATGKKDEAIYNHPMLDLLKRPNTYYSGNTLWFGIILSLVWDGNGYIVKIRSKRDLSVKELWYVPHFMMEPKIYTDSINFIDYYAYKPAGKAPIKILPEDVIHFRYGMDPFNPRKGIAPLKSIARDAATDEEVDNFSASILHNMGVPGILFTPDFAAGQVANFDADAVKKYLNEKFTGDHRGEPMVNKGPTKVQQFGFDPKSMDLATLRAIPEERICAVTGIPAAVVGFGSGLAQTKVGATMKELREMAYEDGIIPLQRIVGPELQTQLLRDFEPHPENYTVKFDLSQVRVLQEDQNALHKRMSEDFNGGLIYLDEARTELGFESTPDQHIRRVPFSTIEMMNGQPTMPTEEPVKMLKGKKGAVRWRAFYEIQLRAAERLTAAYNSELIDDFEDLGKRVEKAYLKYVELVKKALEPDEAMELAAITSGVMQQATADGPLSDVLQWQGHYLSVAKSTIKNIEAIFGISLELPDLAQRAILSKGGKHIALVNIDKQVQNAIFAGLAQGRTDGLGVREIARLIRANTEGRSMYPGVFQEAFDRAKARGWSDEKAEAAGDRAARQYRAETISRTETKYAQNVSSLEVARESGTFNAVHVTDGVYGSPRSGEVDIQANGQIVNFDGADLVIEDEHPNGTLSLVPVIVDPSEIQEPILGR